MFEYRRGRRHGVNNQTGPDVRCRTGAQRRPETLEVTMVETDRRVRRTRRILVEAFVALVLEKGYERLTVQDILDRADVGRSTFYAHYRDKEALLLSCFSDVRDDLARAFTAGPAGGPEDPVGPAAIVFRHAYAHRSVYKVLCGRAGGSVVHRHLSRLLDELIRDHVGGGPDVPAEVVAAFHASATLGLLAWWVDHDFPYGPDGIARMHQRLTGPGFHRHTQISAGG
jgi:AcrR family transcriptional regulator